MLKFTDMRRILFISGLLFICAFNIIFSQTRKKANVKNYDSYYETLASNQVKTNNTKQRDKMSKSISSTLDKNTNSENKIISDTLFYESFSHKSFDNLWTSNSPTENMIGYFDPTAKKKYLKIFCTRPNGNSFLEYDLTNKIKGKKVQLKGFIKTDDVKRGGQSWEVGQLGIKFNVENKIFYECVQNLEGTSDWDHYSAQEDGSDNRDNTENGPYVFYVPENAKNVTLYLGLQNCTGTIYFTDITVVEIK